MLILDRVVDTTGEIYRLDSHCFEASKQTELELQRKSSFSRSNQFRSKDDISQMVTIMKKCR